MKRPKRPGPLLTLLAGLLFGLFMLSLNATTGKAAGSPAPARTSPAAASPAPSATASSAPKPSPSRSAVADADYAERTDDDVASVAVTVRDGRAIAYFCDGRATESWLKGDVRADGGMRLTGKGGAELNGTLRANRSIRGTVTVGGGRHAFTADRARKPSGLYRATAVVRGARIDGGWIVLPDGRQVGVLTRDGRPAAAPALDPRTGAVTVDGRRLTARPVRP
jgi:serine/threonine-protein kinase